MNYFLLSLYLTIQSMSNGQHWPKFNHSSKFIHRHYIAAHLKGAEIRLCSFELIGEALKISEPHFPFSLGVNHAGDLQSKRVIAFNLGYAGVKT